MCTAGSCDSSFDPERIFIKDLLPKIVKKFPWKVVDYSKDFSSSSTKKSN